MNENVQTKDDFLGDVLRFCVAGALCVAIQYAVLVFFVEIVHLNPTFSSTSGFVSGCVANYLLLYFWAFSSNGRHHIALVRYISVMCCSMSINVFIFWSLTEQMSIWYPISQFFATCCSSLFSFIANRYFTFAK